MLKLTQELEIGDRTFYKILSAELVSSRETNSDTLTVQFPKWSGFTSKKLEKGLPVKWRAGYSSSGLVTEFTGVLTDISLKEPLKIVCRDEMYNLQSTTLKKNLSGNLSVIAKEIFPEFEIQEGLSQNVNIQSFGRSKAWALRQLQTYGIDAFFRAGKLILQKPALLKVTDDIKTFEVGFNVISEDLSLRMNRPVKVKLKSYDSKVGKYYFGEYGNSSSNGVAVEEKLIELDGIPQKDMNKRAQEIFIEIAGPGLHGSFTSFGHPSVSHSEIVWFRDAKNVDKNKASFVPKVEKTFSFAEASYRQRIYLDIIQFNLNGFKELPEKFKKKMAGVK